MTREALTMALEALESSRVFVTTREKTKHPEGTDWYDSAITALREALAQPEQVAHTVIAGALFDFMGYLTSRKERIVLSAADDAAPAVDAIRDFAKKRGLSLDDAQVREWIDALAQPEQEPVATVIEELEHDGQGWCSKVRWLYNPVPVGETLSWEQPK